MNGDTQKVQRALEEYIKKVQPGQYRLHFDAANGEAVGKAVSAWGYNAELGGPKITRLVGDLALSGNTQALSDAYRRLAIDVINGGPALREWVDDSEADPDDLDTLASADEASWRETIAPHLIYG